MLVMVTFRLLLLHGFLLLSFVAFPKKREERQAVLFAYSPATPINAKHPDTTVIYKPLQTIALTGAHGNRIEVRDGTGKPYVAVSVQPAKAHAAIDD